MPFGSVFARVWSSTAFCLPFEPAHDAQFFQKPIVSARPPGGGVLSTENVMVWPAWTVKLPHRMLLSTVGLYATPSGGMKLLGTNWPSEVSQPGITISHTW